MAKITYDKNLDKDTALEKMAAYYDAADLNNDTASFIDKNKPLKLKDLGLTLPK